MAIELCYNQINTLHNNLTIRCKDFRDNCKNKIILDFDATSFKLSTKARVEYDNNYILKHFILFLKENKIYLTKQLDSSLEMSIYIWSHNASDTPQIDFDSSTLALLGEIKLNLSIVIYTYDPN